jgi:5'-methylthioadenosine phosphorylase
MEAFVTVRTGFITGTGFYTLPNMQIRKSEKLSTPFGKVEVQIASLEGREIAFIPRHGRKHNLAPDEINYRANIFALHKLGVESILATSVCGSLVQRWKPGTLVLIDQFINFTSGRADSFYPMGGSLAHVDMTDPYCPTLHDAMAQAAIELGIDLQRGATYACFSGPRFETRAEIEMVRRLDGHLVGQTNYPECVLARELSICYATLGVVSNPAAGMGSNLSVKEVIHNLESLGDIIGRLFERVVCSLPESYDCACRHSLDEAQI